MYKIGGQFEEQECEGCGTQLRAIFSVQILSLCYLLYPGMCVPAHVCTCVFMCAHRCRVGVCACQVTPLKLSSVDYTHRALAPFK